MKDKDLEPPRQAWETVEYTDNPDLPDPKDLVEVSKDFLPKPEELVFKGEETVKVSMVLDKESIDFFKAEAKRLHVPYQRMIRNLLHEYVERQQAQNTSAQ